MRKFFFIILFLFLNTFINAQFVVSIKNQESTDTLKTCVGLVVELIATATFDGVPIPDLYYYWDFDDGTILEDINLDTAKYSFSEYKLHRVVLNVWNDTLKTYTIFPVLIGTKPNFSQTKIEPDETSFCKGEEIKLTGKATPIKFKEIRENFKIEDFPQFVNHNNPLNSTFNIRYFDVNQKVTYETNIDSIGIYIEHSKISDLQISIVCPSDSVIILKDFGGDDNIFGSPILEPTNPNPGTGFWYYWTLNPTNGTVNSIAGDDVTIQSGTYLSDSSFTKLIGCQINGDWKMKVIDQNEDDQNGYFFAWYLSFDDEIENDLVQYFFPINKYAWEDLTTSNDGFAEVELESYGQNLFKLISIDSFECEIDTTLIVNVEKPEIFIDFDLKSEQKYIGDSIRLEDKTQWSIARFWIFDDGSDKETDVVINKMYTDSLTYKIVLMAISNTRCYDYDTLEINIIQRPIVLGDYNIFTPNGDGVNDVFIFFVSDEEKKVVYSIEEIDGRVYNRFGEVVCKWNSPEELLAGWDGTINNGGFLSCPSGFYYYVILIKQKGEKPIKQEPKYGTIYLYKN